MIEIGRQVRIGASGVSIFEVVDQEDDQHATLQAVEDVPGKYPFSMPVASLVLVDE
ncbi:hypothetical protein [Nocardia wallacei]|uniref:hypothetical protein n=1 Tax=Nocardia wallacei TaxID=480035 RepID=UPI00245751E8|nr:hypothetical protein [Nocardia wallacei]